MKRVLVIAGLIVTCLVLLGAGERKPLREQHLAIPSDTVAFSVERDWLVQLTGEGIAGSKIEAAVEGPARIVAQYAIHNVKNGKYMPGPGNKEFILRPTGSGEVTVKITSTGPQPGAQPKVTEYKFEVKSE